MSRVVARGGLGKGWSEECLKQRIHPFLISNHVTEVGFTRDTVLGVKWEKLCSVRVPQCPVIVFRL